MYYLITPDGDYIARNLIERIAFVPPKRVKVLDGYGRLLALLTLPNEILAKRVRDVLGEVIKAGRYAEQPDWSFLTQPTPAPTSTPAPAPASASASAPAPAPAPAPVTTARPKAPVNASKVPQVPLSDNPTQEA